MKIAKTVKAIQANKQNTAKTIFIILIAFLFLMPMKANIVAIKHKMEVERNKPIRSTMMIIPNIVDQSMDLLMIPTIPLMTPRAK